jgi:Radical SAM superfamily
VIDMDAITPLRSAPLLFTQPGMGAGDIEVARSCPAWCSFCRLALTTKPYRQATVERVERQAQEWKRHMGSVEMSPFSPDFPMHTRKKELLAALMENVSDEVDGTAMRIDDFIADPDYMALYTTGRATAVTLGLEGNSQRMRDLAGKGTSDKEVIEAVTRGIHSGVRKFKLFMISQFPGEEQADVMRIVRLGQRLDGIRRELGAANVQFIFSWTPLLIEAQTPFQWFAPTPPDHTLMKVIEQLRPYRIVCKIGTKANPAKVALFQLCQRASRDVGEAIVDVLERHSVASWGGVPQTMREDLEEALQRHGFLNGLADCFDDRDRADMFGWEHIDMGVSLQLLWSTHVQMVEFLQATDPETYDEDMGGDYHGQEWIGRCDKHCEGAACGACEPVDFRKRREYIAAADNDRDIQAQPVRPIDLSTVAVKIRMKLNIPEPLRYASKEHWRFNLRRAAYRAADACLPNGASIAKRSIRFTSDVISVRDWSYGFDYAEFALTQHVPDGYVALFMNQMMDELAPWAGVQGHERYPASGSLPSGALAFYELAVDSSPDELAGRLASWERAEAVPLTLTADTSYFGPGTEEVNAKELVEDIWAIQSGHQVSLRFLARGKAGPYQLAGAFLGKPSIPLQRHPALRREWFHPDPLPLFAPSCLGCGRLVLLPLLGEAASWCHRCGPHLSGQPEVFLVSAGSIG